MSAGKGEENLEPGIGSGDVAFAIVMVVAATLLGLAHVIFVGFTCEWDASTCAHSVEKTEALQGTLRTQDGSLYRSAEFEVEFPSREDRSSVTFETDERGRYCIWWASERGFGSASTPSGEPLVANEEGGPELPSGQDGARPADCEEGDAGVPWNHADDAESTWQNWLLILLPIAAITALLLAMAERRQPYALRLFVSGGLLFGANLIAFVVLWFIV